MNWSRISLGVILVAGCSGLLHGAMQENRPPELFTAMKQDARNAETHNRAQIELQRQADSIRDVERIRNLPPHAVAAVAQNKISFKDLQFTDDDVLVDNGVLPPSAPSTRGADNQGSTFALRAVGLSLGVALVFLGLTLKHSPVESTVMPSRGKRKDTKLNDLEE